MRRRRWRTTPFVSIILLAACGGKPEPGLPSEAVLEALSPDGKVTARILRARGSAGLDMLGSDDRYFLALKHGDVEYIVRHDLSEGFGTYEGGVEQLRWQDNDHVLVRRSVADRRKDIVFDIKQHTWRDVAGDPAGP